jgi:hypothetical protein
VPIRRAISRTRGAARRRGARAAGMGDGAGSTIRVMRLASIRHMTDRAFDPLPVLCARSGPLPPICVAWSIVPGRDGTPRRLGAELETRHPRHAGRSRWRHTVITTLVRPDIYPRFGKRRLGEDDPVQRDSAADPIATVLPAKAARSRSQAPSIGPRSSSTTLLASNDTRVHYRCSVVHGRTGSRALGQRE